MVALVVAGLPLASTTADEATPQSRADALVSEALALAKEKSDLAVDRYRIALELYQQAGDVRGQVNCRIYLATLADARGDSTEAEAMLSESLPLLRELGDEIGSWLAMTLATEAAMAGERYEKARDYSQAALSALADLESSERPIDTATLLAFGKQANCPNADQASLLATIPPPLRGPIFQVFRSLNLDALARSLEKLGELEAAIDAYQQLLEVSVLFEGKLEVLRSAGRLSRDLGRDQDARDFLNSAVEQAREEAKWRVEIEILLELADFEISLERQDAARERFAEALAVSDLMSDDESKSEILRRMDRAALSDR